MPKGKSKGTGYERQVAKDFSLWWSNGKRDDIFWRPQSSGGRATVRLKKGLDTPKSFGDMMALDPIGDPLMNLFVIEIKRGYNDLSFLDLVDIDKKFFVLEWIEKAEEDRLGAKAPFFMITFKRDRHQPCIMMKTSVFAELEEYAGWFGKENSLTAFIKINGNVESFVIVQRDKFFKWCTPEIINLLYERMKNENQI